jgi:hypothetical protein
MQTLPCQHPALRKDPGQPVRYSLREISVIEDGDLISDCDRREYVMMVVCDESWQCIVDEQ